MTGRVALFLDRDGVINDDSGYVYRIEDFRFRDGIFDLCAAAQAAGLSLVVVTNQAGIGRGYYTEADFHRLTEWMLAQFRDRGIALAGVEFCPDHPDHGIGAYRRDNPRRKPGPGMILDACARMRIDARSSLMIGDRATDMLAGRAAGIGTLILIPADRAEADAAPPDTIVLPDDDLLSAADYFPRNAAKAPQR
ncbi:HAD family hydrolase [Roseomonas terrae]|uniref:D,D-heptose 1,7-bisphosphate phosphatase n=1 Tax=Neoroseomonas terrae TaxID=424799 RepID=A0ABS5EG28_9PROT|nr:HAD family hydrolase [Neoroseomonas terrae]MBR0649981.1 HAD family hydrolase [Neoroseomonas terrae]